MNEVSPRHLAPLCLLAVASAACLGAPAATPYGVWQGTLGTQEVVVNLQPPDCASSYYYVRHLRGILLKPQGAQADAWREGANANAAPAWHISQVSATSLDGQWVDAKGQRRLPLHLKKLAAGPEEASACNAEAGQAADAAFNDPRVAANAPVTRAARFEGHAYQVLMAPHLDVRALQLADDARALPHLNQQQRRWLQAEVVSAYDCQLGASLQDAEGPAETYSSHYEPVFWNAHVLVARQTYAYHCGGPYPDAGLGAALVWDLDADMALEPGRWLRGTQLVNGGSVLTTKVQALVARHYARAWERLGGDCTGSLEGSAGFSLYPTARGMVFTPIFAHVARACEVDTVVPWAEIKPFLTPEGAQLVREKVLAGSTP